MNIRARIKARKLVLSYFYEKYFFLLLEKNQIAIKEILSIDNSLRHYDNPEKESEAFAKSLSEYSNKEYESVVTDLIDNFFEDEKEKQELDMEYVFKIIPLFNKMFDETEKQVNLHTSSFKFYEMDIIDRCLFILGYCEFKTMDTPKEVIINELVELAKAYGDEGSPKLINGIAHKMFEEKTSQ